MVKKATLRGLKPGKRVDRVELKRRADGRLFARTPVEKGGSGEWYELRRSATGAVTYCTCPSWKNDNYSSQGKRTVEDRLKRPRKPEDRECKHIQKALEEDEGIPIVVSGQVVVPKKRTRPNKRAEVILKRMEATSKRATPARKRPETARKSTCGDSGGVTARGTPCKAVVPTKGLRCSRHPARKRNGRLKRRS